MILVLKAQPAFCLKFEQAAHYYIRKGLELTMTSLQGLHSGTVLSVQDVSIPSIPVRLSRGRSWTLRTRVQVQKQRTRTYLFRSRSRR